MAPDGRIRSIVTRWKAGFSGRLPGTSLLPEVTGSNTSFVQVCTGIDLNNNLLKHSDHFIQVFHQSERNARKFRRHDSIIDIQVTNIYSEIDMNRYEVQLFFSIKIYVNI